MLLISLLKIFVFLLEIYFFIFGVTEGFTNLFYFPFFGMFRRTGIHVIFPSESSQQHIVLNEPKN